MAIGIGVLVVGAVVLWRLQGPPVKSCRSQIIASVTAPDGRHVARAVIRDCDVGLKSGHFVFLENSSEPGVLHEAFYSARKPSEIALTWREARQLQIAIPEIPDSEERRYDGLRRAGGVLVKVVGADQAINPGS